eukprot:1952684-Rhodomonas_salina.1
MLALCVFFLLTGPGTASQTNRVFPSCDDANARPAQSNPLQQSPRLQTYSPILAQVRRLLIERMPKPEEVLVVEDENGEVVKEHLKDVEVTSRPPYFPPFFRRAVLKRDGGGVLVLTGGGSTGGGAAQDGARDAGLPHAFGPPEDRGSDD